MSTSSNFTIRPKLVQVKTKLFQAMSFNFYNLFAHEFCVLMIIAYLQMTITMSRKPRTSSNRIKFGIKILCQNTSPTQSHYCHLIKRMIYDKLLKYKAFIYIYIYIVNTIVNCIFIFLICVFIINLIVNFRLQIIYPLLKVNKKIKLFVSISCFYFILSSNLAYIHTISIIGIHLYNYPNIFLTIIIYIIIFDTYMSHIISFYVYP